MAKSSVPRHSRPARKPVTIELKPESIETARAANEKLPDPEPVGFDPASSSGPSVAAPPPPPKTEKPSVSQPGDNFGRPAAGPGAASTSTPVPPARAESSARLVLAGLAGGILALLGAAALQWGGVLPSPGQDISKLEADIAQLRQAPAPALDQASVARIEEAAGNARSAVERAEGVNAEIASIRQELAAVKDAATNAAPVDTSALDGRIAGLENSLPEARQQLEQGLNGLTQRLDAIEAKVNDPAGQADMALALAATGLKAAVDRGQPFRAELDTYLSVAPEDKAIQSLAPQADAGVPTLAALADQFADVAPRIVASARQVDPNAGIVDRLWASAANLVEARPVGMVEGEGVDAKSARIEAHLRSGNLQAAIDEWNSLPPEAKTASQAFGDAMSARLNANKTMSEALTGALSGVKSTASQGVGP